MSQLSPILRDTTDNGLVFTCPGCEQEHRIQHGEGTGPRWSWNGDVHKPTFQPSLLIRTGHFVSGHSGDCWCTYNAKHPGRPSHFACTVCHSFITDGNIQFLSDCTHALAGQTVPLPPFPTFEE